MGIFLKAVVKKPAVLAVLCMIMIFSMAACGGGFYSQTSNSLKAAAEGKDSEQVFSVVSDVFSHYAEAKDASIDISSLNTEKIGAKLQRNVFSGFKETGTLPYVDVTLSVKQVIMHTDDAELKINVSFEMDGKQHERSAPYRL